MNRKLDFVLSAYNTAQSMNRFSDQKASMIFLFYGVFLALLGTRVGRLVEALRGQDLSATAVAGFVLLCAFLGLMSHSLMYALRTIAPTFVESNASPEHRRLYWFEDVLQRGVREYIQTLQGLSDEQVLQEMAHELYSVQTITRAKFERIQRATRSAAASLMVWQVLMVLTFFL